MRAYKKKTSEIAPNSATSQNSLKCELSPVTFKQPVAFWSTELKKKAQATTCLVKHTEI